MVCLEMIGVPLFKRKMFRRAVVPDIEQFATQVAKDFRERQKGKPEPFNLELPEKAVVDLVKAAFYASMIPDEERWPSVSLMCYKKEAKTGFHFLFNEPVEVSAQQIAKLAHAVAYRPVEARRKDPYS